MIMANIEFPKIRACLFDMDGLLIDSEDIYTECDNVLLHKYGKPSLPWKIKAQLQGRPSPESSKVFHAWAELPISPSTYSIQLSKLQAQLFPTTQPLPGASLLLENLVRQNIPIALATSSHAANFKLKSSHLDRFFSAFPARRRVLGDDPRIPKGRGKPAPDIYLLALETINKDLREKGEQEILPRECLVFEDAVLGVEAGRAAGMRVVWCPHPMVLKEYRGRESEVLAGIVPGTDGVKGVVGRGRLDDGWAELVETLEGFSLERYGIPI